MILKRSELDLKFGMLDNRINGSPPSQAKAYLFLHLKSIDDPTCRFGQPDLTLPRSRYGYLTFAEYLEPLLKLVQTYLVNELDYEVSGRICVNRSVCSTPLFSLITKEK